MRIYWKKLKLKFLALLEEVARRKQIVIELIWSLENAVHRFDTSDMAVPGKVLMQGKLIAVVLVYSAYILKPVLSGRNL